jgi:hypothetical protein
MPFPVPHARNRPVRILFVFAWLAGGDEEAVLRSLAQDLDPARYRLDAFVCRRADTARNSSHHALRRLGVDVDCTAQDDTFDDTVAALVRKIAGYEIIVSTQNVADIYPALDRLLYHPGLVEYGRNTAEAAAGPKHLTTRYVATSDAVRDVAADRMPGRAQHAVTIPLPQRASGWRRLWRHLGSAARQPLDPGVSLWTNLFEVILAEMPAPPPRLFRSFVQGGFECSTQRLHTGRRLDVIAATQHDTNARSDYQQLAQMGLCTVRDGARWHLIEHAPGSYDFSSFAPMVEASKATGTQVIWDLLHYGWPDDLDIWQPDFVTRFAAFARATALAFREITDEPPFWSPVNEISYFAWAGGDDRYLNPFAADRGLELKLQLARASIAATQALRAVDPRARFVQCEPLIAIHPDPATGHPRAESDSLNQAQYQAFDMLTGAIWPQIGGDPSMLDIIGVNYYPRNQWHHLSTGIDVDHPSYRPLSDLLFDTYARYRRPLFISETGVEDDRRPSWLNYVASEVARARRRGIPVEGLCLYPILNHPGWDDDRPCQNGLMHQEFVGGSRDVDPALARALRKVVDDFAHYD